MEQKRNHDAVLVTLADRNFIKPAKQLFSSVYWNAGWKGDYMLLSHEIPEKELKWFRDKGILVKKCKPLHDKSFSGYGSSHPPVVLDKFYLFTPELKKWKNIVFLDADIIVRASIERLARVKKFSSAVAFLDHQILREFFTDEDKSLKSKLEESYNLNKTPFNCGVMAFPSKIISKSTFSELVKLLKEYMKVLTSDDPVFNLFFYNKWKKLPTVYDIIPSYMMYSLNYKVNDIKGIILHLLLDMPNDIRPWNKNSRFYPEWRDNLDKAELIDLNNRPQGKEWGRIKIIRVSLISNLKRFISKMKNRKTIQTMKNFLYYRLFCSLKNFTNYKIIARLKIISARILGIIGQIIKKVSPSLYYKLKGKNGTKKKS